MESNRTSIKASNVHDSDFQKVANKVSLTTIIINVLLSVIKFAAGIIAHSNAMISDAVHSASDVLVYEMLCKED